MDLFAYAYCALMVAGFIGAWKFLINPLTNFGSALEKTLSALPSDLSSGEAIDGRAFNGTLLEPYWTRFTREWSKSSHSQSHGREKWSVIRPDEIFNFHDMASDLSNVKYIMAMPALMTGLGLLGTFTGLIMGISALDLSGSENLLLGIKTLLGGTKLAFSTSLTGILLALLWGHAERITLHRISRDLRELCSRLNHRFPCLTQESILIKILEAVETSPDLKPSLDMLTEKACSFFDGASDANRRAVESMVDTFISSLNRSMRGQLSEIGEFLRGVESWHGRTQTEFDKVMDHLREVLTGFESIVRKNDETARAGDRRLEAITNLMARFEKAWTSSERTLSEASMISSETSASLARASETLRNSVSDFERVSRDIAQTTDQTKVAEALEKAASSFDSTVNNATKRYFDNFDTNIDDICSKIGRIAARTASASEVMEKRLTELNDILTEHVRRLDENLNGTARDSSRSILERLGIVRGKGR